MTKHYDFNNGDICYDSRGNEYVYQAAATNGHVVCPVLQFPGSYDDLPYTEFGEPTFISQVFTDAPTQKQHDDLAKLEQEVAAKRAELLTLRSSVIQIEKDAKDRVARLKQHEALRDLDRIMNGEVTHYVVLGSYPKILDVAETKSEYDSGGRRLRMLSVMVTMNNSTKQVGWSLSRYYDGSGGADDVVPCFSLEEAEVELKAELTRQWQKWATTGASARAWEDLEKMSKAYGVEIPEAYATAAKAEKLKFAQEDVNRHVAALELAQKKLESLNDA